MILADERCVVSTHEDSNLGAVRRHFTDGVDIPRNQVYGIDETLLTEGSEAVARSYSENIVKALLDKSGGMLDCVVLVSGTAITHLNLLPSTKVPTTLILHLFVIHRVLVQMVTPAHYFPITNFSTSKHYLYHTSMTLPNRRHRESHSHFQYSTKCHGVSYSVERVHPKAQY